MVPTLVTHRTTVVEEAGVHPQTEVLDLVTLVAMVVPVQPTQFQELR
jgi:hypothetical protein